MPLLAELKRRNVFRVAVAYAVVAWLLIEVSDTIFPRLGLPDWTVTFVIALFILGMPPALFFAWAYELTPEGLKKEREVERSDSITQQTGRKLDRVIIALLVLAIGFFAFDRFVLDPQRDSAFESQRAMEVEQARQAGRSEVLTGSNDGKSIAVLPFVNMSDDAGNEYFSDGISEELLNLLAKVPELRVTSRSSAFAFKGEKIDIPEVARKLNVAHVLEGSVRKAGNRVRITAQLIEARSDAHLWSETYDRTLEDIFAVQDEIAATVVDQLKITLLGEAPQVRAVDPRAYELFLQALHLRRLGSAEGYEEAIALSQQALAAEPDYPAAWGNLAAIYANQAGSGLRPFEEGFALSRVAAEKALAIDPDFAQAHAALGWIATVYDADLVAATRHYERALALEPENPIIIGNAAALLISLDRIEEAVPLLEYGAARDPLNPTAHFNLAGSYYNSGLWNEVVASCRAALRLSPDRYAANMMLGIALLMKGERQAALEAVRMEKLELFRFLGLSVVHHALGQQEESDRYLAEAIGKYERDAAYNIAYALAYRNEKDRAFEWLDKAVEYGDPGLTEIAAEPLFANLHDDPRWLPFLERIGMSPAQLAAIEFRVRLPGK